MWQTGLQFKAFGGASSGDQVHGCRLESPMQAGDSYINPPWFRAHFRKDAEPEFIGFADDENLIPSFGNCPVPE
jgi:hypothetical protein